MTDADETRTEPTEDQQQAAFYQGVLADIADTGRVFARLLAEAAERAAARGEQETLRALELSHDRTTRGIRKTTLLAAHLKKLPTVGRESEAPCTKAPPKPEDPNAPERPEIHRNERDRLDRLDSIADLLERPLPEAIDALRSDVTCAFEELGKPTHRAGSPENLRPQPTASPPDDAPREIPPHGVRQPPDD